MSWRSLRQASIFFFGCAALGPLLVNVPIHAQDAAEASLLSRDVTLGDSRFEAATTITTIMHWSERLLGPNARREDLIRLVDWAANATVVIKPPGSLFHDQYSNRFGISSSMPLSLKSFTGIPFGVNIDPWMSVSGATKGTELNLLEMAAVLSEPKSDIFGLLFPDTVRLDPQQLHKDAFASFMASQGDNAINYHLLYVRYFVGPRQSNGAVIPKPRIAYAYTSQSSTRTLIKFGPVE